MSPNWAGILGISLVILAYFPQIFHLVKKRCSTGISLRAYLIWSAAAVLLLGYAVSIYNPIFIVLQSFQLAATGTIVFFTRKYGDCLCEGCRQRPAHATVEPRQTAS